MRFILGHLYQDEQENQNLFHYLHWSILNNITLQILLVFYLHCPRCVHNNCDLSFNLFSNSLVAIFMLCEDGLMGLFFFNEFLLLIIMMRKDQGRKLLQEKRNRLQRLISQSRGMKIDEDWKVTSEKQK